MNLVIWLLKFIAEGDRKSTRLNSSHLGISYAVFCLKKKKNKPTITKSPNSHPTLHFEARTRKYQTHPSKERRSSPLAHYHQQGQEALTTPHEHKEA